MKVGKTGRVALVSKSARVLATRHTTSSDINKKVPTEINAFKRGNDVSNDSVFKAIKNAPTRQGYIRISNGKAEYLSSAEENSGNIFNLLNPNAAIADVYYDKGAKGSNSWAVAAVARNDLYRERYNLENWIIIMAFVIMLIIVVLSGFIKKLCVPAQNILSTSLHPVLKEIFHSFQKISEMKFQEQSASAENCLFQQRMAMNSVRSSMHTT